MDMIWFSLKSIWCAMAGCYQCVDYNVPEVMLPDSFYVEKIYNDPPKTRGSLKWKGEPLETYRYAATIDGLVYRMAGPAERSNTSDAVYRLTATSQEGEPITLRATISEFVKKGNDNLLVDGSQNKILELFNNHSYESVDIAISHSESGVYVLYEVVPLVEGFPSKSPLVIRVNSYKSYPNSYCYSEFR